MKRIIITLSIFIVILLATCILKTKIEGLCGNYTLTYAKVKDIFSLGSPVISASSA